MNTHERQMEPAGRGVANAQASQDNVPTGNRNWKKVVDVVRMWEQAVGWTTISPDRYNKIS